ncbi:MAG: rane protein [Segetibacter sp.]|nr:rane protein [Segetibacter sp.]
MENDTTRDPLSDESPAMAGIMERNIKQLIDLSKEEEKEKTNEEKIADTITRFTGNMAFVYVHIGLIVLWIIWNSGAAGIKPLDPSFVALSVFASVEALFLTAFVLISQNRMNVLANKRSNLDLHISLLAEHEVTRLITLVTAIAKKLDIEEAKSAEFEELARDINPEKVLETMDKHDNSSEHEGI